MRPEKVSILMLTHNAPGYVELSVRTVCKFTFDVRYELVVVDNASGPATKKILTRLRREELIQHLFLLDYNSFFAGGNNIAAAHAAEDSTHFLLLNSDIKVKEPGWLSQLLAVHRPGITAYGVVDRPLRVDGYCLLIDAPLYRAHRLDEAYQFFWAVTKLQAKLLTKGYSVQGFVEHERYLHHFGGKSGKDFKSAEGLVLPPNEVTGWFQGKSIRILDAGSKESLPTLPKKSILHRGRARLGRIFA